MNREISPSARRLGYWSAVLASAFSLAYIVAQPTEWVGMLGAERWICCHGS
jgi:hypothetical protein